MSVPPRVAQLRARTGYSDTESDSPQYPSPPRAKSSRKHRSRHRGHSVSREKPPARRSEPHSVTLLLCVFRQSKHEWKTEPLRFDPRRINDRELWFQIRDIYRQELQKPWRRIFGFQKLKHIVPIAYSLNGVPIRTDPKNFPDAHTFTHSYRHPDRLRPDHSWVDWFVELDRQDPDKTNGLEFVEGLWADKLAVLAIIFSVAIVVVSIVWCVLGGVLQTVFTVMSFVLTFVAALIALMALYYQVKSPSSP